MSEPRNDTFVVDQPAATNPSLATFIFHKMNEMDPDLLALWIDEWEELYVRDP